MYSSAPIIARRSISLSGTTPVPGMLWEYAEPIGFGKDAFGDVDRCLGAALLYIKADAGNMRERFKCEAHSHMVIDEIYL